MAESQKTAMAELVAAIAADVESRLTTLSPALRRPFLDRVAAAKARLRAALLEATNG